MGKSKDFADLFRVKPGKSAHLSERDPSATPGLKSEQQAKQLSAANVARIAKRHSLLRADNRTGVLVILQGMDTAGKDGTITHVLTGVNPLGCSVASFGVPSKEELDHDFLWRVHKVVPPYGTLGVFNRSHYEDVLVVRVHGLKPKDVIKRRYEQINRFEEHLVENNYTVLKFMLHISRDEQAARLRERVKDPTKNWKMNLDDLKERQFWDDYMDAYEDALTRCSTPHAPWYVIPANNKWFRNAAVSTILADTLETLDLEYPKATFDPQKVKVR